MIGAASPAWPQHGSSLSPARAWPCWSGTMSDGVHLAQRGHLNNGAAPQLHRRQSRAWKKNARWRFIELSTTRSIRSRKSLLRKPSIATSGAREAESSLSKALSISRRSPAISKRCIVRSIRIPHLLTPDDLRTEVGSPFHGANALEEERDDAYGPICRWIGPGGSTAWRGKYSKTPM